ncbi:MAG: pilin [Candidatus Shapirobacteria bacterium]
MFRRIFRNLLCFLSLFFLPRPVFAQPQDWATNPNVSGRCVMNDDVATIQGFECLFYNILQVITFFAGLAFLYMFLYGGFQYLFSSSDQKKVAAASSTLTMSIMGLIGIIASFFIFNFIETLTGVNVTDFTIPGP